MEAYYCKYLMMFNLNEKYIRQENTRPSESLQALYAIFVAFVEDDAPMR